MERYDIVRWCAAILRNWDDKTCAQMANGYLGLVALRENNRELAINLLLEMKPGYKPQPIVFRLAEELFTLGERESINQLIYGFKKKIPKSKQMLWLNEVANNKLPDFTGYCSCATCRQMR